MRKRTESREAALKVLYQAEITRREISVASENFWADREDIDDTVLKFCERITSGVQKHFQEIDDKIVHYAANWQLKRMAVIDRNILRIGVFEMLFTSDVPPKVCINEAVELAKKYGDLDSSKFVNGILDKIHKVEILSKDKDHEPVG
ncbi:MAG: transcription antitermination factor NusB [Candidatus Omnitrophica bacterium]|nr:transcription antitermination factor NusB [Candidatus Omnitrophota bacterium]